jgi:hypothetical protein
MVAFSTADLPTSINTVEKLHVWASMVLNNVALQATIQEVPNLSQPVAVSQIFTYADAGTQKWRHVGRVSVELDATWQTGAAKPWTYAQAVSATAIPTAFKS